jgi:uncharacterized Rmd1/YagE family protein
MSFLNELNILLERKDVIFSDNVLKMTKKILSFIKTNKSKLFLVAHYREGEGFYIKYTLIDPKSDIHDLYVALLNKTHSSSIKNSTIGNPAALATYQNKETGKKDYILRLYIFDNIEDEKRASSVINKIIASPQWSSNIYHELTHYLDAKRQNVASTYSIRDFINDSDMKVIMDNLKKYYNLSDEINAHFMQATTLFWKAIKKKDIDFFKLPFEKFKDAFIYFYGQMAFTNLDEENKKRILKRIYLLYQEFQEAISKKEKK